MNQNELKTWSLIPVDWMGYSHGGKRNWKSQFQSAQGNGTPIIIINDVISRFLIPHSQSDKGHVTRLSMLNQNVEWESALHCAHNLKMLYWAHCWEKQYTFTAEPLQNRVKFSMLMQYVNKNGPRPNWLGPKLTLLAQFDFIVLLADFSHSSPSWLLTHLDLDILFSLAGHRQSYSFWRHSIIFRENGTLAFSVTFLSDKDFRPQALWAGIQLKSSDRLQSLRSQCLSSYYLAIKSYEWRSAKGQSCNVIPLTFWFCSVINLHVFLQSWSSNYDKLKSLLLSKLSERNSFPIAFIICDFAQLHIRFITYNSGLIYYLNI